MRTLAAFIGTTASFIAYYYFYGRYKEISWRDFVYEYLKKGTVQSLDVVNKRWVRIKTFNSEDVSKIKLK